MVPDGDEGTRAQTEQVIYGGGGDGGGKDGRCGSVGALGTVPFAHGREREDSLRGGIGGDRALGGMSSSMDTADAVDAFEHLEDWLGE